MLIPTALHVQGFRSFRDDTGLRFPSKAGLYMLTGINRRHPELGRNAVGKSSVWDAMCWAFYGKSSRGLKGPQLANWADINLTTVVQEFRINRRTHLLSRTHAPNSLSLSVDGLNPRPVEQEYLDHLVGLSYEGFLATVLMGQFNQFFFDLSATDKLNSFSNALGLESWLDASRRASSTMKEAAESHRALELELAASSLKPLKEEREYLRAESQKFSSEKAERMAEASQQVKRLKDQNHEQGLVLTALEEKVNEVGQSHTETQTHLKEAKTVLNDAKARVEKDGREEVGFKEQRAKYAKQINEVTEQKECPTCRQRMSKQCIAELVREIEFKKETLIVEERGWATMKERNLTGLKKARKKHRALVELEDVLARKLNKLEIRRREAERAFDKTGAELAGVQKTLELYSSEVNPHRKRLGQIKTAIVEAKASRKRLKKLMAETEQLESAAKFWTTGFKELRLWVVEEALIHLTIEVNNALASLGLEGWEISFDVERELAKGTMAKGFTVNIKSPESKKPVRWEVWCGGETQRLRIAGAIGLANLVRARTGVEWFIEVWDEPTQHLSDTGVMDLTTFLADRARIEGRQVWLVDHRALDRSGFEDVYSVILERKGGARIVRKR